MPSPLLTLACDARDPGRLAEFWASLLGREAVADAGSVLVPGSDTQVGLRFDPGGGEKVGRNRAHLHLTATNLDDQAGTVARALALGAHHLDVGQRPEEGHVVLADPEDNELCVIEPHNSYLAGCGFLGEVGCEGTREVGLFWAAALAWPLVWEEGDETALQSPAGGTKVAWGGAPVPPLRGRSRHRFDLTVPGADLDREVQRLVALGATRLDDPAEDVVVLADPDGNDFRVRGG